MNIVYKIFVLLASAFLAMHNAFANNDDHNLVDDANRLCSKMHQEGFTKELRLKGSAKAELENILKKIGLNVELSGVIDGTITEFSGVFQKDLAESIQKGNECRLKAFEMLKNYSLKIKELENSKTKLETPFEIARNKLLKKYRWNQLQFDLVNPPFTENPIHKCYEGDCYSLTIKPFRFIKKFDRYLAMVILSGKDLDNTNNPGSVFSFSAPTLVSDEVSAYFKPPEVYFTFPQKRDEYAIICLGNLDFLFSISNESADSASLQVDIKKGEFSNKIFKDFKGMKGCDVSAEFQGYLHSASSKKNSADR